MATRVPALIQLSDPRVAAQLVSKLCVKGKCDSLTGKCDSLTSSLITKITPISACNHLLVAMRHRVMRASARVTLAIPHSNFSMRP